MIFDYTNRIYSQAIALKCLSTHYNNEKLSSSLMAIRDVIAVHVVSTSQARHILILI